MTKGTSALSLSPCLIWVPPNGATCPLMLDSNIDGVTGSVVGSQCFHYNVLVGLSNCVDPPLKQTPNPILTCWGVHGTLCQCANSTMEERTIKMGRVSLTLILL